MKTSQRTIAFDLAFLVAAKGALAALLVAWGFTHVSDDDYARTVIAEGFAHAPRLDPSGTSWLPLPFWITGSAMIVFGRTLGTARGVGMILGALSVVPPYVAARAAGVKRGVALVGTVLAAFAPWNAWLGAAMTPEAFAGALVAAAVIGASSPFGRVVGAVALLAASLSRYEAWPACAVLALASAWHAWRARSANAAKGSARVTGDAWWLDLVAAGVAALGPLAWMAWNAYAHGDAFHFFARVAAYRRSMGGASVSPLEKWLEYPRALVEMAPVIAAFGAIGATRLVERRMRARWGVALLGAAAIVIFLVIGDVRDGAPTHHPARALVAVVWIVALFAADSGAAMWRRVAWGRPLREVTCVAAATSGAILWIASRPHDWRAFPGQDEASSRDAQIERGLALRREEAPRLLITPCAYEHFALLAAFGAPEKAELAPPDHSAVTASCPRVVEMR